MYTGKFKGIAYAEFVNKGDDLNLIDKDLILDGKI